MPALDDRIVAQVHRLWDELADLDAARTDESLDYLMRSLCELVDAQNATWVGSVRLVDAGRDDPAHGWRPREIRHLHPSKPLSAASLEQVKSLEQGSIDVTTVRNISLAGSFRVNRLIDLVPESWFDSAYYKVYYRSVGHEDAIWTGFPVNEDAEAYFGVFRTVGHARFTEAERDAVGYALRGLKWFHRQQMLGRGLMVAHAPLTVAERGVLQGLLAGQSEKQIAATLDRSYHTVHEYVAGIYRKFGVGNRAALMALWLGKAPAQGHSDSVAG